MHGDFYFGRGAFRWKWLMGLGLGAMHRGVGYARGRVRGAGDWGLGAPGQRETRLKWRAGFPR